MKKLFLLCGLAALFGLFLLRSAAQTRSAFHVIYVTNTSTTVPTNFTAGVNATTNINASVVTVRGQVSPRVNNAGTVYIGTTSGNDTQPYPVTAGGEVVIRIPEGRTINLRDWWVDVGTANDGICIIYQ